VEIRPALLSLRRLGELNEVDERHRIPFEAAVAEGVHPEAAGVDGGDLLQGGDVVGVELAAVEEDAGRRRARGVGLQRAAEVERRWQEADARASLESPGAALNVCSNVDSCLGVSATPLTRIESVAA
jgi:hypothetical protein